MSGLTPGQLSNQIRLLRFMHGEMTQAELSDALVVWFASYFALDLKKVS